MFQSYVEIERLDCRGLRCPLPIIKSAEKIKSEGSGYSFLLLSDDPATEPDLVAWSRMTGNHAVKEERDVFRITKA